MAWHRIFLPTAMPTNIPDALSRHQMAVSWYFAADSAHTKCAWIAKIWFTVAKSAIIAFVIYGDRTEITDYD